MLYWSVTVVTLGVSGISSSSGSSRTCVRHTWPCFLYITPIYQYIVCTVHGTPVSIPCTLFQLPYTARGHLIMSWGWSSVPWAHTWLLLVPSVSVPPHYSPSLTLHIAALPPSYTLTLDSLLKSFKGRTLGRREIWNWQIVLLLLSSVQFRKWSSSKAHFVRWRHFVREKKRNLSFAAFHSKTRSRYPACSKFLHFVTFEENPPIWLWWY